MKRMIISMILMIAGSLLTGCMTKSKTQDVSPQTKPAFAEATSWVVPSMAGGVETVSIDISAVVTAIDQEKRTATLQGPQGKSQTVHVGPKAVNFDQVAVGDMVNVKIVQEVMAFVAEAGSGLTDATAATAVRAAKGEQPGGAVAGTVQMVATIIDLDVWNRMVELQFADGSIRTHSVRPDVIMEGYEVGDKVVIQITEMVAVDITKK
jgi:hypothetical protein